MDLDCILFAYARESSMLLEDNLLIDIHQALMDSIITSLKEYKQLCSQSTPNSILSSPLVIHRTTVVASLHLHSSPLHSRSHQVSVVVIECK